MVISLCTWLVGITSEIFSLYDVCCQASDMLRNPNIWGMVRGGTWLSVWKLTSVAMLILMTVLYGAFWEIQ